MSRSRVVSGRLQRVLDIRCRLAEAETQKMVVKVKKGGKKKAPSKYALRGTQLPKEVLRRLKKLKVDNLPPPEVKVSDIEVNSSKTGLHDKAVISWREGKVKKHGYTPRFHEKNAQKKWDRIERFKDKMPAIVEKLAQNMRGKFGTAKHQAATVAFIIAKTGLRPGSQRSEIEQGRHGVSTLKKEHVKIEGDRVNFDFIGKAGERNTAEIKDADFAKKLRRYMNEAGDDGKLFEAGDTAVKKARGLLPKSMKLKDMRTIAATTIAADLMDKVAAPPPLTGNKEKDRKLVAKAMIDVSEMVAEKLNNTPAVARKHYIHPKVMEKWLVEKVGATPELFS